MIEYCWLNTGRTAFRRALLVPTLPAALTMKITFSLTQVSEAPPIRLRSTSFAGM